jgi:hypothetical protein
MRPWEPQHTNVEAIRVLRLELRELCLGLRPRELNVVISRVKVLCQVHLQTCWGSNRHLATAILLKQLRKHLANREASAMELAMNPTELSEILNSQDQ